MILQALELATWNIQTGRHAVDVAGALDIANLDIACLQEVDRWTERGESRDNLRRVFASPHWSYAFTPSLQDHASVNSAPEHLNFYGNSIATRHRIVDTFAIDLGPLGTDRWFSGAKPENERRTALFCRIHIAAHSVLVATTHLQYGAASSGDRRAQARLLRRAVDHVASEGEAVILAGDLNADRDEVLSWSLFDDFTLAHLPAGISGTYPSNAPEHRRRHIDHILVRGAEISCLATRALPEIADHDLVKTVITLR